MAAALVVVVQVIRLTRIFWLALIGCFSFSHLITGGCKCGPENYFKKEKYFWNWSENDFENRRIQFRTWNCAQATFEVFCGHKKATVSKSSLFFCKKYIFKTIFLCLGATLKTEEVGIRFRNAWSERVH